jgi:hypothetical protein
MAEPPDRSHRQPMTPLAGREREQAARRDALAAALAGRGSPMLGGGDAGSGKTALAEALVTGSEARGALALVGRWCGLRASGCGVRRGGA